MHRAVSALAMLVMVSACTSPAGTQGSPAEARSMVAGYLEAAAGGEADSGWSLLMPASRRAYDIPERYIELATAAAWHDFGWELTAPDFTHCEDGGVYCEVRLEISGDPPEFLLEAPNSEPTDRLRTITLDPAGGAAGNAWMVVYFDTGGSRGISTGGG